MALAFIPATDYRLPTKAVAAKILCADARSFFGFIFMPPASRSGFGAPTPGEWMNEETAFFPFLPSGEDRSVLLNKDEVVVISVDSTIAANDVEGNLAELRPAGIARHVHVECGGRSFEGTVFVQMPDSHSRMVDFLNTRERFLCVHDGPMRHLVRKTAITRVTEIDAEQEAA